MVKFSGEKRARGRIIRAIFQKIIANKDSTNLMILFLSFSNVIGNALTIISGLFVARWLLPEELGFFNGFSLVAGYVILAQIGIPSGLSRELPLAIGKGAVEKAHKYAAVAQLWQMTLGVAALLISLVVSVCFVLLHKFDYAAGTFVIGAVSFQGFYVTKYLKVLYRTNSEFNRLSQIGLIVSFTSFASIFFVWKFGFYGLCIRAFVIFFVDFFFTWRWRPISVGPQWDRGLLRELFKIGFPMFCIANIYGLWPLLQRTLILSMGGTKFLGLFAVAVMVENAMRTITSAISSVTYPKMIIEWGQGASVASIMKINIKPLLWVFLLFAVAVPVGWLLLPTVIQILLPNYVEGLRAAQWMLLVGLIGMFTTLSNIYNVIRRQRDRFVYFGSGILSWLCIVYLLFSIDGFSLEIFPKAMCAGLAVMLIVNLVHLRGYIRMNFNRV